MVETRTKGNDFSAKQLVRYQYSNHLGSACLELDDAAKIISYEEYHPYGTSAYRATDASRQVPARRYRYTGVERDDETGLNYHMNRYYAPWLGRWTAADPSGVNGGTNLYEFVNSRPVIANDPTGNILWFVVIAAIAITALTVTSDANAPGPNDKTYDSISNTEYGAHVAVNAATMIAGGGVSKAFTPAEAGFVQTVKGGMMGGAVAGATGAPLNRAVSDVAHHHKSSAGDYTRDTLKGAGYGLAAGGVLSAAGYGFGRAVSALKSTPESVPTPTPNASEVPASAPEAPVCTPEPPPKSLLMVGPENQAEFDWLNQQSQAGYDTTAVNPNRTPAADAFVQDGGKFVEGGVEDVNQKFDWVHENFPQPLVRTPQAVNAAQARINVLKPGGKLTILTENPDLVETYQWAAESSGASFSESPFTSNASNAACYPPAESSFVDPGENITLIEIQKN